MKKKRRLFADAVVPICGFVFCFAIWSNLPRLAKTIGGIWFLVGLAYDAWRTHGFRDRPATIDFS